MRVLIIGSGGREHTLAWKSTQSPLVNHTYVAPGNAGTALLKACENVPIEVTNLSKLLKFAQQNKIDLTIVGPETPLVLGIVDLFKQNHLPIFGPTKACAQLEGSKAWCKSFLLQNNIPTADYQTFDKPQMALNYLQQASYPIVIKDDSLCAGKGVTIATSYNQAQVAINNIFKDTIDYHQVVIEEFIQGEEASFMLMVDGQDFLIMATSQDHKARDDGDTGPNTGGMGAYSPAPIIDAKLQHKIIQKVIRPTLQGLKKQGLHYQGFLYAGLMIDASHNLRVLEYNCRLGDPETQPILMRLKSDLIAHCLATINAAITSQKMLWHEWVSMGVVMASEGYPNKYQTGHLIHGIQTADTNNCNKTMLFHAGTVLNQKKQVITSGGRVLCATSIAPTLREARQLCYELIDSIHWQGCYYRKDIGHKALEK